MNTIPVSEKSETLFAHWYCQLNAWRWPEDWGEPPQWIKEMMTEDGRIDGVKYIKDLQGKSLLSNLMASLKSVCGERECSRVWNVLHTKHMTESEWEQWWKENGTESAL